MRLLLSPKPQQSKVYFSKVYLSKVYFCENTWLAYLLASSFASLFWDPLLAHAPTSKRVGVFCSFSPLWHLRQIGDNLDKMRLLLSQNWQSLGSMVLQWFLVWQPLELMVFSLVPNHWSNDGMVHFNASMDLINLILRSKLAHCAPPPQWETFGLHVEIAQLVKMCTY